VARAPGPDARAAVADRVEWAVGALAAALVAGVVGFLVYEGVARSDPPALVATPLPGAPGDPPGILRFAVANAGGRAASGVVVSALVRGPDGGVADRLSLTVDHVPPGGHATGAFLAPAGSEIVVEGWLDP
jgi:uncharacterized protein (TIGR02588 family)